MAGVSVSTIEKLSYCSQYHTCHVVDANSVGTRPGCKGHGC